MRSNGLTKTRGGRRGAALLLLLSCAVAPLAVASPAEAREAAGDEIDDRARLERLAAEIDQLTQQGRMEEAEARTSRELAARLATHGDSDPGVIVLRYIMFGLLSARSAFNEATALGEELLPIIEDLAAPDDPFLTEVRAGIGQAYAESGRPALGEPLLRQALEALEQDPGSDAEQTQLTQLQLARTLMLQSKFAEADEVFARVLAGFERRLGEQSYEAIFVRLQRAQLLSSRGDLPAAEEALLALRAQDWFTSGRFPDLQGQSVNMLCLTYVQQGRFNEMADLLVPFIQATEGPAWENDMNRANALMLLGHARLGQDRLGEAEVLMTRAVEDLERLTGRLEPMTVLTVAQLALALMAQSRGEEALSLIASVSADAERNFDAGNPAVTSVRLVHAMILAALERYAESAVMLDDSLRLLEAGVGPDHPATMVTRLLLAGIWAEQGDHARAEPVLARIRDSARDNLGANSSIMLTANDILGALYFEQQRYAEAETLFEGNIELARSLLAPGHPNIALEYARLAMSRLRQPGTAAAALSPAREAAAILRDDRPANTARVALESEAPEVEMLELVVGEDITRAGIFLLLAEAAWAARQADPAQAEALRTEAFEALQRATVGAASGAISQMAIRRFADSAGEGLGALVREREELQVRWNSVNQRISMTFSGNEQSDLDLRESLRGEKATIEARLDEIDARLREEYPDYFALVRPQPVEAAAARAMLADDEALLITVSSELGTQILAVTSEGMHWAHSDWTEEQVRDAVARLRWDLGASVALDEARTAEWAAIDPPEGPYSYDRATAHAVYRAVVAPVADALAGKRHLFVIAGGELGALPFSVLVSRPPEGADNDPEALRSTHWLADDFALTHIPSVQSLALLRRTGAAGESAARDGRRSFAGFGDPVLEGTAEARGFARGMAARDASSVLSRQQTRSGGAIADVSALRSLARLPGTAIELERMRAALGAPADAVRTGAQATETAVRNADLSHVDILAFATHGLTASELAGAAEPGLVLTPPDEPSDDDDGFLSASEVTALRLDADWIILSACNTASGEEVDGSGGISGLARAFFYAGARNLLASYWPVNDEVAARLTVRTIELRRESPGLSRAEAFRMAMAEVRDDPANDANGSWAHPAYWAPFILVGDGAR